MSRQARGDGFHSRSDNGEFISLSPCRSRNFAVIKDVELQILNHLSIYERDNLTSIARALNKDPRRVYDALKRLIKRCFVEKERRGLYKITELGKKILNEIKAINPPKNSEERKNAKKSQGKSDDTGSDSRCSGVGYVGRFFDNVKGYIGGSYVQSGRDALLSSLAGFDRLSYFEVTHVVKGFSVEGVVVIYTNEGDLERFNDCVTRVEWRPPRGVVKSNPPASVLRLSRFEFVKSFKALTAVLKELLLPDDLADLYAWLGRRWGLIGCEGWSSRFLKRIYSL
jgi:DNA-binding MarR family transcriptional regulator